VGVHAGLIPEKKERETVRGDDADVWARLAESEGERAAGGFSSWAVYWACWLRTGPVGCCSSFFWFFFSFSIFCPLFILGFGLNKALF
jgi:hypothetical protein